MPPFRFKQFSLSSERSAMKLGTDAVLLGAAMTLSPGDRRLLDIGTGSGIIALMAAQRLSAISDDFSIEAMDIDGPSIGEASENFALSPWKNHLMAIHCDLKHYETDERYDLIFSNPPYYDNSLLNPDDRESAARHTIALSYRDILLFAKDHLEEGGRLSIILPAQCFVPLRRDAVSRAFRLQRVISIRTTVAKAPSRVIAEFVLAGTSAASGGEAAANARVDAFAGTHTGADAGAPITEQLTVFENGQRTAQYAKLTEEFYL